MRVKLTSIYSPTIMFKVPHSSLKIKKTIENKIRKAIRITISKY